jgi:hypothetical protein
MTLSIFSVTPALSGGPAKPHLRTPAGCPLKAGMTY